MEPSRDASGERRAAAPLRSVPGAGIGAAPRRALIAGWALAALACSDGAPASGPSAPAAPSGTPRPEPSWTLVWSDELDGPAGQPPDPASWTHEIGDGADRGIPGWGNRELQYYTDAPDNASTDGEGHLAITALASDGTRSCYYGPCQYTSARLVSKGKVELTYGRFEARIRVPPGAGLWPAFWALGANLGQVGWPRAGEIDIMEFVGREPNEVFGTIHGPGYSGGSSYGGTHTFPAGVHESFHVFAVEWEPERIAWSVDDVVYHTATPADVAPNDWVFDHPFFLILNVAVGGTFGGDVAPETQFPARMLVDYVRVYQDAGAAARVESRPDVPSGGSLAVAVGSPKLLAAG